MSEAARDRLTLGVVEARCQLLGTAADSLAVERRLDTVARETLPDALAAVLAQQLSGEEGVIRIDRIELDLMLSREAFETSALPRLWADRIGAALAVALARGERAGVARFPDHGAFVAAYLAHRFGVARHPDFAFADFAPLAHVAPGEAAAELLAARPDYLASLARANAARRDVAWLARRLGTEASARILDAAMPEMVGADAAMLALVRRLIATAPQGWRTLPAASAALALVLGSLAGDITSDELPLPLRATAARTLAAVAQVADTAPELVALLLHEDESGALELLPLTSAQRREAAVARAVFAARNGQRLAFAIEAVLGLRQDGGAASPGSRARRGRAAEAPVPRLNSPFAGFALMLPLLRAIGVDNLLSPGQARAVIAAVIDAPARTAAPVEALADLLLPFAPEPSLPPWPRAVDGDPASACAEGWAARLLALFADRLPGLQGSSAAYLRRQFLHVGGSLVLDKDWLTVRIARPPLAIVLTIGGHVGDQGPLPWRRERSLRILMP